MATKIIRYFVSINLYLVRHAESDYSNNSAEKSLTEYGIQSLKKNISVWQTYNPKVDIIITSPLQRAVETGEIIREIITPTQNILIDETLNTGAKTESVVELLRTFTVKNVLVVGHMPDLSMIARDLLKFTNREYSFSPATISSIMFENGVGKRMGKSEYHLLAE